MKMMIPDLSPVTRFLRAKASAHLMVAAVHYFKVFELLQNGPLSLSELREKVGLQERPAMVLFPALLAMNLLQKNNLKQLCLSETGQFLTRANPYNLVGYVELEKDDPGVLRFVEWLQHDGPCDTSKGVSYVKDEATPSPMDEPAQARFFTLALAGRARQLAPLVAATMTGKRDVMLDVAGGTGYYTFEWLLANPHSSAILFDRPEVLKVAAECAEDFCHANNIPADNLLKRLTFLPGDMLIDPLPKADLILAASVFHDWPVETCRELAQRLAAALIPGGELWVHDAFLYDSLDGPLAVTDYSAMLFLGTRGRAYSRKEYRSWFTEAGLIASPDTFTTGLDYSLIYATKPGQ